jgi:hypothetical protein
VTNYFGLEVEVTKYFGLEVEVDFSVRKSRVVGGRGGRLSLALFPSSDVWAHHLLDVGLA